MWKEPGYYWYYQAQGQGGEWVVVYIEPREGYEDQGGLVWFPGSDEPDTQKYMVPGTWGPRIDPPQEADKR